MTRCPWETEPARRIIFSAALCGAAALFAVQLQAAANVDVEAEASQHENAGDLAAARAVLEKEAALPGNVSAAAALAQFLDRHGDARSREAYLKWASEETDPGKRKLVLRQIVLLDFMGAKRDQLAADLAQYRAVGGSDLEPPSNKTAPRPFSAIVIPGPLPSFARMAALSPDLAPENLLPALARNVVTSGYEASTNEALQQTEYLRLLIRYIAQARELQAMAGKNQTIVIPACDSEQTGSLLKILGYRMRGSCGTDIVLETVNPTRAFLTIDSGFPLTRLEQDLRANRRFELPFASTQIPVLYDANYWLAALGRTGDSDFIDAFLSDPSLCRLYLGLSHLDRATADALRKEESPLRLKIYAHVLDFFGSMFQIRNGVAVVPGSPRVWAALVGVSPSNPGAFYAKLIGTDDGWLASYFDALSRLRGPTAAYLTQPDRMKRFYEALRGKITSPGPARPVFRSSTELLLLTTSLRIDPNGQPHVPGDLDVWRVLFVKHPHGKYDGRLTRSANSWHNNDDLIEALFGLSRKMVENEPLKIFLALNDIDRGRSKPISAQLASRLIAGYRSYGAQYILFAEEPALAESSIEHYLDLCGQTLGIRDTLLRADTAGTLQALVGIWEILCRENAIPADSQNAVFAKLIEPFGHVKQDSELFDAGRSGVTLLLSGANARPNGSRQQALAELLVGQLRPADASLPYSPAQSFWRIFDAQHLISLDTLFTAADRAGSGNLDRKLISSINEQAGRASEPEPLRGSLSSEERSAFAEGYWSERHLDRERKVNWNNLLKSPDKKDARGVLAPFLRDSLVGIVYCYYAPAGAQLVLTNPSFVRSHDFIGPQGSPFEWRSTEVAGTGWPSSGGGRLMGSLITLPYTLADAEQNFLTPRREQALIWGDLVPQMIIDVTITRWKNVTPEQIRWISLHVERGRTLLAAAALDPSLAPQVFDSLGQFATPARVESVRDRLRAGDFAGAVGQIPTSELYALANDPALDNVQDTVSASIATLAAEGRPGLTPAAISHAFGTPKPTLRHSFRPNLLELRTFPTLMGYSSRILAETWESNNLYYAALADEVGARTDELDCLVPEWNRAAIENIFATHLEDWPALLRSLNTVASNVRQRTTERAAINNAGY